MANKNKGTTSGKRRRAPKKSAAKKSAPINRTPRAGHTRRPYERMMHIHDRVRRGRYPNCSTLGEELEVQRKTIQRDINFMRDDWELPLVYDDLKHGYFYSKPVGEFPCFQTTKEDLLSLIVARRALRSLDDTQLAAELRNSLRQIAERMKDQISVEWTDLDQVFSVKAAEMTLRDLSLFEKLSRAVLERREIRFDYTKLEDERTERRHLQPYHLAEIDGGWYVIGHDLDRGARRTFAVPRMKGLSLLKKIFDRPDNFQLEDHFAGSFGVWTRPVGAGEGKGKTVAPYRIRVRFTGFAARFVPERRWHPSQDIRKLNKSGNRIELRMELTALEDFQRWVMSFGSQAEVLEPEALREAVRKELAAAVEKYG